MGPSQAMGTFLRVWRSEWASLSRAQLTIALHGVSSKAKGVTARVIRRWEEGQPPSELEEFEALCQVMRHRGLAEWEVEDFRRAVFAACVDRQYPEMLATEDFAQRDDVEEVASDKDLWFERSIVTLVSCAADLDKAALIDPRPGVPMAKRRRQEAALALMRHWLALRHGMAGRHAHSVGIHSHIVSFMEERFGEMGLGGELLPCRIRSNIGGASRHARYGRGGWPRSECRGYALEAYESAEQAWSLGVRDAAGYEEAVGHYADNEDLVQKSEQRLEESRQAIGKTNVMVSHSLLLAHLWAGRYARAEEHLADMLRTAAENSYGQMLRVHSQAVVALYAYGSLDEAERLLSQCLEDSTRQRFLWFAGMMRGQLDECRRLQETAAPGRRRPKRTER